MTNRFVAHIPNVVPWRERARVDPLAMALARDGATDAEAADVFAAELERLRGQVQQLAAMRPPPVMVLPAPAGASAADPGEQSAAKIEEALARIPFGRALMPRELASVQEAEATGGAGGVSTGEMLAHASAVLGGRTPRVSFLDIADPDDSDEARAERIERAMRGYPRLPPEEGAKWRAGAEERKAKRADKSQWKTTEEFGEMLRSLPDAPACVREGRCSPMQPHSEGCSPRSRLKVAYHYGRRPPGGPWAFRPPRWDRPYAPFWVF